MIGFIKGLMFSIEAELEPDASEADYTDESMNQSMEQSEVDNDPTQILHLETKTESLHYHTPMTEAADTQEYVRMKTDMYNPSMMGSDVNTGTQDKDNKKPEQSNGTKI